MIYDVDPAAPTSTANLASLLTRSAGGDERAFAAFYDATVAHAHGLGLRVLRDPGPAAEVVQEAYLHLWTHSARFDPACGSALSWVLMTVHCRAARRVRSARAALGDGRRSAATPNPAPPGETPPTVSVSTEVDQTHLASAELSSTQRHALDLAYFEGYTHSEVEGVTGLPAGTARSRIREGLQKLHSAMGTPVSNG